MRFTSNERMLRFKAINWTLLMLTVLMTVYFQSSSRLTNAYGLTVCCDSVITTVLYLFVLRSVWRKHWLCVVLFSLFLIIDLLFWVANAMKFLEGAWIAILISLIFFAIGFSWYYGERRSESLQSLQSIKSSLHELPRRVGQTTQRSTSFVLVNNASSQCQSNMDISIIRCFPTFSRFRFIFQ